MRPEGSLLWTCDRQVESGIFALTGFSSFARENQPPRQNWGKFKAHNWGRFTGRLNRSTAKRFLDAYRSQLRPFETEYEVAPGVVVTRTGGHTPGHSVVRLASGADRLMFAGDAVFAVGFEHPEWYNGFEHDPAEAASVRVDLLRELAATGEALVATRLSFPTVCHVAVTGDAFRSVPAVWDY